MYLKEKQYKIAMILLCPVQGPWASSYDFEAYLIICLHYLLKYIINTLGDHFRFTFLSLFLHYIPDTSIEQNGYLVDMISYFQLGSLYPSYTLYFFQILVLFVGYFGMY